MKTRQASQMDSSVQSKSAVHSMFGFSSMNGTISTAIAMPCVKEHWWPAVGGREREREREREKKKIGRSK